MERAATAVDFLAAQFAIIHHNGRAQATERFFRDGRSRAVAAIEPYFQPAEIGVHRRHYVIDILGSAVAAAIYLAAAFDRGRIVDIILYAALLLFAVLHAVAVENFDAVVLGRIVRSGNHNTASRAVLFREHRHRGRGYDAGQHDFAAHIRQSLDERGFQFLAGHARVAPHDAAVNLAERKTGLVSQRFVEFFAVLTSYSVRAEIFTHTLILLFAERRKDSVGATVDYTILIFYGVFCQVRALILTNISEYSKINKCAEASFSSPTAPLYASRLARAQP